MDLLLIIIGFCFIILGFIAPFVPIIPGAIASWIGIFFIYLTNNTNISKIFILLWLLIAISITILDYILPIISTKKVGGTKFGTKGFIIGMLLGVFFTPIGMLFGGFLGVFIGELIDDDNNIKKAIKTTFTSFIAFVFGTGMKFFISVLLTWYFLLDIIQRIN